VLRLLKTKHSQSSSFSAIAYTVQIGRTKKIKAREIRDRLKRTGEELSRDTKQFWGRAIWTYSQRVWNSCEDCARIDEN